MSGSPHIRSRIQFRYSAKSQASHKNFAKAQKKWLAWLFNSLDRLMNCFKPEFKSTSLSQLCCNAISILIHAYIYWLTRKEFFLTTFSS